MAKVMLVEDDNNLREIYEARLLAEGYEIVSAKDGEEALALAVKEQPDLIISDIMMPNISGFDMLDILRSTPETKNTKVIMMTALSQAEDKVRANKLGADRYLVKSQVTLEDVVRTAQEVLEGSIGMPQHETGKDTPAEPQTPKSPPATPNPPSQPPTPPEPTLAGPTTNPRSVAVAVPVAVVEPPKVETTQQPDSKPDESGVTTIGSPSVDPSPSTAPNIEIIENKPDPDPEAEKNPGDNNTQEESEEKPPSPADQNDDNTAGTDTISSLPVVEVPSEENKDNTSEPEDKPADNNAQNADNQNQPTDPEQTPAPSDTPVTNQLDPTLISPNEQKEPSNNDQSSDTVSANNDSQSVVHTKVIKPINDLSKQKDHLKDLIAEEAAKDSASQAIVVTADTVEEGSEAPPPQTVSPNTSVDPNSVAL